MLRSGSQAIPALGGMEKQIPFRIPNAAFRKISIPHSRMGAQLYPFVRSCRNAGGAIIHSECSIPEKSIMHYSIPPNAEKNWTKKNVSLIYFAKKTGPKKCVSDLFWGPKIRSDEKKQKSSFNKKSGAARRRAAERRGRRDDVGYTPLGLSLCAL